MPYKNKADQLANAKKWREANPDKIASYRKNHPAYYLENREKIVIRQKEWRAENKEKLADYNREWSRKNKDKASIKSHTRRAKKQGNGIFAITEKFMKKLYSSACVSCGTSEEIEADHIVPIVKGGRHSEGNLQPLCRSCNSTKGPKLWIDYVAKKRVVK